MSADPKDVVSAQSQEAGKIVDDQNLQAENVALQRRVDELEGMLEQKHGWLTQGIAFLRAWSALAFPNHWEDPVPTPSWRARLPSFVEI